MPIIEPCLR